MKRLVTLAAGVAVLFATGCTTDGQWSVRKALGLDEEKARGSAPGPRESAPIAAPKAPIEVAERVELIGKTIIAQNTFTGLDPMFFTIGVPEAVLFHRGTKELFISEGLVKKCRTDAELAAVMCAELGKMVVEKRTAKKLRRDTDPIPDSNFGGSTLFPGGTPTDSLREVELASHEKKFPRGMGDPNATARDLLKGAGYSPLELDRVEGLLRQSDRGEKLQKQMSGSAPAPTWEK